MDECTVAWFAGLFEGEGCIDIAKANNKVRLTIRMTDRDIIDRVNALFPCKTIGIVNPKPVKPWYNQPKTQFCWRINKRDEVEEILNLILPWLGERRSERAREALEAIKLTRGRVQTHCINGHAFTPENTAYRKGTPHRRCRECQTIWSRNYRARQSA